MPGTIPAAARALVLALLCAGCESSGPAACLPPARDEPEEVEVTTPKGSYSESWYCEDPPPGELLDGSFEFDLIWVEGEDCDPCDRERIAGVAATYMCEGLPTVRLLCGPIAYPLNPWDRQGCLYAVAYETGCIID